MPLRFSTKNEKALILQNLEQKISQTLDELTNPIPKIGTETQKLLNIEDAKAYYIQEQAKMNKNYLENGGGSAH